MKLSEEMREYETGELDRWADKVERLEAEVTTLENECIRLEDETDTLREKYETLQDVAQEYLDNPKLGTKDNLEDILKD